MIKKEVIKHLEKLLKHINEIKEERNIRVYVHINERKAETDIEIGGIRK